MEIEAIKTSYARWALFYDKTFGLVTNTARRRAVREINTWPAKTVLEVGVGTGMALEFYRPDLNVTGVDFSAEMLAKAQAKVNKNAYSHVKSLLQMDARELDFPDNSFDVVVAMHVVSVVPEPERVVAEMARVCKPGGKVLITNHFARKHGLLGALERLTAPLENLLGWHSDFEIDRVLGADNLQEINRSTMPPLGMMTRLLQEKIA